MLVWEPSWSSVLLCVGQCDQGQRVALEAEAVPSDNVAKRLSQSSPFSAVVHLLAVDVLAKHGRDSDVDAGGSTSHAFTLL